MKESGIKRLYYSISEVSKIADEEQYVLRYWETEFEQLRPQKNRAGNRIYTEKDIMVIKTIKKLLREKRYTIEGAKEILKQYRHDIAGIPEPDAGSESPEPALQDEVAEVEHHELQQTLINQKTDQQQGLTKQDLEEIHAVLQHLLKLLASFFIIIPLHVYY